LSLFISTFTPRVILNIVHFEDFSGNDQGRFNNLDGKKPFFCLIYIYGDIWGYMGAIYGMYGRNLAVSFFGGLEGAITYLNRGSRADLPAGILPHPQFTSG